jgi:hypothetical protein
MMYARKISPPKEALAVHEENSETKRKQVKN